MGRLFKKDPIKKKLRQNAREIISFKSTYLPQKAVLVNKDFYDEFVKWLNKKVKSPQNLNTHNLLINGRLKPNLIKGKDYELINLTFWQDITEKFGSSPKIEAIVMKDPKSCKSTLFVLPQKDILQFNIYLPFKNPQTNGYSNFSSPIEYFSEPDWVLKDVKEKICRMHDLDPGKFSFARHETKNAEEQISDNFKMSQVLKYSKNIDLKFNRSSAQSKSSSEFSATISSARQHKRSSENAKIDKEIIQPNNNRNQTSTKEPTVKSKSKESSEKNKTKESSVKSKSKESFEKNKTKEIGKSSISRNQVSTNETFEKGKSKEVQSENNHRSSPRMSTSFIPKPVGLRNLGNTCFFNAAVQCLIRVMPLTSFVLSDRFSHQLNPNNRKASGGSIARSYRCFLEEVCASSTGAAVDPTQLRRAVVEKYSRFANYGQHDSQELLCCLLDGLHEDMNQSDYAGGRNRPIPTDKDSDAWEVHISRNSSPVVDIFHGILYSSVHCPNCNHDEEVKDPFIFLSLPIQRRLSAIKLEDCLDKFSQKEALDSRNKWRCENCRKMVCASKEMGVWSCGKKVIIIHFKRFSGDGQFVSKIDTPVNYPDVLNVGRFAKNDRGYFRLIGAVFHSGGMGGGHYTAAAIDPMSGSWFYFNDSSASKISRERAHQSGAYILFYQRQE